MLDKLSQRIRRNEGQSGFTLIELLVVIIIIGILLAIAIPSYLSFRTRANKSAAQANVRSAIPAVEAYYADNSTYASMSLAGLQASYDAGVKNITVVSAGSTTYCISSVVGSESWYKAGPSSDITSVACT